VTEERARPTREDGRVGAVGGREGSVAHGVDAGVDGDQAARLHSVRDGSAPEPEFKKLSAGDVPPLTPRQSPD
jgi:hypothetical protein